jgi:DNA-binding phage protein
MTQNDRHHSSLYEEVAAGPTGARDLAAARAALRAAQLLQLAKQRSGLTSRMLADRLGVGESRVSQVLNGDGNLHIATVARFLHAMGYELELSATAVTDGAPLQLPSRSGARGRGARTPASATGGGLAAPAA